MNTIAVPWLRQATSQDRRIETVRYAFMTMVPIAVLSYRVATILCVVTAILLLTEIRASLSTIPQLVKQHRPLQLLVAILVLGLASTAWCIDTSLLFDKWGATFGLTTIGLMLAASVSQLTSQQQERIYGGFSIGVGIGLLMWICFAVYPPALYHLIAGAKDAEHAGKELAVKPLNLYSVLIWLALPWLSRNLGRYTTITMMISFALALFVYDANGARIGIVLGLMIWGCYAFLPWQLSRATFISGCTVMLLAPPLIVASLPIERGGKWIPENPHFPLPLNDSNQQRIMIWDFALRTYKQAPVIGYGFGNARTVPGADEKLGEKFNNLTLHPHNATLQAGMELGTIGIALITFLLLSVCWSTRENWASTSWRTSLPPAIANGVLLYAVSYGLWQSWLLALIALSVFITKLQPTLNHTRASEDRSDITQQLTHSQAA